MKNKDMKQAVTFSVIILIIKKKLVQNINFFK